MKGFDENIIALINMLEYDMWLISPDKHVDCVCKNFDTDQATKFCPYCFGLGYKIKVKKIKGVRQPMQMTGSGMQLTTEVGVYFFKEDYKLKDDDVIVWNDEIEQVTKTDRFCSDSQKPVYFRCETKPKKTNNIIFLKHLYRAIGKPYKKGW